MKNFKPHFLTLGVKNLEHSRKFYEEVLKLNVSKVSGDIVFYDLAGIILGLYPDKLLAKDATLAYEEPNVYRGLTISHNVENKKDVDDWIETLRLAGAKIVKEPEDVFWGGRSAYFKDPDGHLWEISWNPFVTFEQGGLLRLPD